MTDLSGKIAIVTGENSGMGLSTVEALNNKGATVIMRCMNEERGRTQLQNLQRRRRVNWTLLYVIWEIMLPSETFSAV